MMTRWVMLASVLGVVAAACGDDGHSGQLADAPPESPDARVVIDGAPQPGIDGGVDAPPAPIPMTVTVTLGGSPARGQTVYVQSPDSATTTVVLTGADGVATSVVQPGDFVTVIDPEPPPPGLGPTAHLSTFAGVKPGDHLFVDVPVPGAQGASVNFTVNTLNEQLGYEYTLFSTCGSADIGRGNGQARVAGAKRTTRPRKSAIAVDPVTANVTLVGCGGVADLLVVGTDGENGVQSWQYLPNTPLIEGGTVDFTSYSSPIGVSFTYTGLPGSDRVAVTRELRTARGTLYTATGATSLDGSSGSSSIQMPDPDGVLAVTTSVDQLLTGSSQPTIIEWGPNDISYSLDIPAITLHAYSSTPSFDPATHTATWPSETSGQTPALTLASVVTSRSDGDGSHTWTWDLVAPWSAGTATYPVLPTTIFDFNPSVGDEPSLKRLTTAAVPGGYDAARPRVFAGDVAGGVAGATGQIVLEDVLVPFMAPPDAKHRAPRSLRRPGLSPRAR